jgi:predicted alpha/beta hydrolase family esterase
MSPKFVLAPTIKILLDIFQYISDEDHRRQLQEALDAELTRALSHFDELVLVAHSLGTVIAL